MADDPVNTTITQDTVQANDAINAPTSIMQNTQVNSGVTHDSYGGGVSCARTTMQVGAISSVDSGPYDTGTQVFIGFNIPLGSDTDCEEAAKKQSSLTHQRTRSLEEQMNRDNQMHDREIKKKDLLYADLLAKICLNYHDKIVAANDSLMSVECARYRNIDHHKPEYDKNEYSRLTGH